MSQVWYKDKIGYVSNDEMTFYPFTQEEQARPLSGVLASKNGSTDGKNEVTMRSRPKDNSYVEGNFKTGSHVDVFQIRDDGWCEVECGGRRGYIKQKNILLENAQE